MQRLGRLAARTPPCLWGEGPYPHPLARGRGYRFSEPREDRHVRWVNATSVASACHIGWLGTHFIECLRKGRCGGGPSARGAPPPQDGGQGFDQVAQAHHRQGGTTVLDRKHCRRPGRHA